MTSDRIAVAAAAKLNLYLHVTGRRPDGYHELDSLVVFASVHDTVSLTRAPEYGLTVTGPFADALDHGSDNLALVAAQRLAECAGITDRVAIHLEKRLPVAAGIGGGSADAAATLIGLRRLWRIEMPAADWNDLALGLGADVPVCLAGGAAFVGGVGERLTVAPSLPSVPMVLVNPGVGVSTAAIFARRTGAFGAAARFADPIRSAAALADILAARGNDLYAPAVETTPAISEVVDRLGSAPECLLARMSGSGGTCFGLFADAAAASQTSEILRRERPEWWAVAADLLTSTRDLVAD